MGGDTTLTYTDPGAGGFIDLAQFGIKPERDKYYARVNPKTGCWECVEIPCDGNIPTQGKTAHLKFDRVSHARPIMCVPDRIACGCGCGCAACEPTVPDNGDPMPCLRVTKSCDPAGPYKVGDDVVFAFVVENCGNTDIMGIQLDDDMTTVEGGPIDLAPGAIDEMSFTAVVKVTADMIPGGFTNNVTATGMVPESSGGGTVDATDSHTVTTEGADPVPGLSLVKSCDPAGPYELGDVVAFTFAVENTGDTDLTGITIVDDMTTVIGGPIDLAAGAMDNLTFTASVTITADIIPDGFTNNATATGTVPADQGGGTVEASDSHTVTTTGGGPECVDASAECPIAAETLQDGDGTVVPKSLSLTDLGCQQLGERVVDGVGLELSDFPWTITTPASDGNCILFLHLSHGAANNDNLPMIRDHLIDASGAADLSAPLTLCENVDFSTLYGGEPDPAQHSIYAFEVTAGSGGQPITVDFATKFPGAFDTEDGVVMAHFSMLCDAGGEPCTFADLNAGGVFSAETPRPDEDNESGAGGLQATVEDFDAGECDAVLFMTERHVVTPDPDAGSLPCGPGAWLTVPPSGSAGLAYHTASDPRACQLGQAATIIAGGSGAQSYTVEHNTSGSASIATGAYCVIPTNCTDTVAAITLKSAECEVTQDNANAVGVAVSCTLTTSVIYDIPADASASIIPVIDGVDQTALGTFTGEAGTLDIAETYDGGTAAAGATDVSATACIKIVITGAEAAAASVEVGAGSFVCDLQCP